MSTVKKKTLSFRPWLLLLFLALSFIDVVITTSCEAASNKLSLVKVTSDGFTIENKSFRFIGANAVNLVFYDDFGLSVQEAVKTAKECGITVLRLFLDWGRGKLEDYDVILDLASHHNIYVILTLVDCQSIYNKSNIEEHGEEYPYYTNLTDVENIDKFKNRIREIIMHKNSINGRIYRDDTTIFAWDIANEPKLCFPEYLQMRDWISEIATYIKSIDSSHLVTVGFDTKFPAFDSDESLYEMLNIPELDFFSFHFYAVPKDREGESLSENYKERIAFRTKRFLSMGKPVIMEEFGFSSSGELNTRIKSNPNTARLYYRVFKESMDAAFSAGASGVIFWGWGIPEAKDVSMWWSSEIHDVTEEKFSTLIRGYKIHNVAVE